MNPYHAAERNGWWIVLEGNLIVWASCATQNQAERIAKALHLADTLTKILTP